MNDQVLIALLSAIGGSIITSLVSPYILQTSTRRTAKADTLRKLLDVEISRWAGESRGEFRKHQIELKAAVLVAGGSRMIVDHYSRVATVARSFSDLDKEDKYFDGEGGIPLDIAESVSSAATLLSQSIWSPYFLRFIPRLRLKKLIELDKSLEKKYKKDRGGGSWTIRII
jgi:hypothetical protein